MRNAIAALIVLGVERHDEYIELARRSVLITDEDYTWKFSVAEELILDEFIDACGDNSWLRIERMERVAWYS